MSDVTPLKEIRSAIVSANMTPVDTFKFILRGTTRVQHTHVIKFTDDTRDLRKEILELKIRRDTVQHAPYSLDLAAFDFVLFPPTEIGSAWKAV